MLAWTYGFGDATAHGCGRIFLDAFSAQPSAQGGMRCAAHGDGIADAVVVKGSEAQETGSGRFGEVDSIIETIGRKEGGASYEAKPGSGIPVNRHSERTSAGVHIRTD